MGTNGEAKLQSQINAQLRSTPGILWRHDEKGRGSNHRHRAGWPDLEILLPDGDKPLTVFVELKTESGRLSADQHTLHFKLRSLGYIVYVVRNMREWDIVCREISFTTGICINGGTK